MPRACSVCIHKDRTEIEAAAIGPEPNRRVATRFRITESSLRRHLESHLPRAMVVAREAAEMTQADTLLGRVHRIETDARRLLQKAEETGDFRCAIAAAKTSLDVVELLLKVREAEREPERSAGGFVVEIAIPGVNGLPAAASRVPSTDAPTRGASLGGGQPGGFLETK
jgi:hypothetical protein